MVAKEQEGATVSHGTLAFLRKSAISSWFRWFTIAELVVVITILAFLSTIGFLAYLGYASDAADAASKSNVRSVYQAISVRAAETARSPRYFVEHDANLALEGAVVVFDDTPVALSPGPWDAPGTNYSSGRPKWVDLRLDPEKFRTSSFGSRILPQAYADSASELLVGTIETLSLNRSFAYVQVATVLKSSVAIVEGDFPSFSDGSAPGLIKDTADPSGTGALVSGTKVGTPAPCEAAEVAGYDLPDIGHGASASVSRDVIDGTVSAVASCRYGTVSLSQEEIACADGFVPASGESGPHCAKNECGGVAPSLDAKTVSNAISQNRSDSWHYSDEPGQCTFACDSGRTWDGSACHASCETPASYEFWGLPYAMPEIRTLGHGWSAAFSGTHAFGSAPLNGTLSATFSFSCSDGTLSALIGSAKGACQENHQWNSDAGFPACAADVRTVDCGGSVPPNGTASTADSYPQTYDGLAGEWLPNASWSLWAETCGYSCDANFVPTDGACVGASRTVACVDLPRDAVWNSVSEITQVWDGISWDPSENGSYGDLPTVSECRFACSPNHTWNTVSCQADVRTFSCAAKPATGTVWNSVDSYQQTWDGSTWAPADSTTSYSTSASSTACRYECASGYGWDSSASLCKPTQNASCGSADGVAAYGYPTANHCSQGTKTDTDTNGTDGGFDWTCSGAYGWTAATCSAPKKADGACGTASGATLTEAPSANLCSAWTASVVTGTGPWNWTCSGTNSGSTASCSSQIASYLVTFDANGGSALSTATKTVSHGSSVWTFPATTRTGYALAGWFTQAEGGVQISESTPVVQAATYYAQWTQNQYAVTLNASGGSGGTPSVSASYGSAMPTATMPTLGGFAFDGYYDAVSDWIQYYTATMASARNWDKTSATTLYARWIKLHSISFRVDWNRITTLQYASGSLIPPPSNPVTSGYSFQGWFKDAALTQPWNFSQDRVSANTVLYAASCASGTTCLSDLYYIVDPAVRSAGCQSTGIPNKIEKCVLKIDNLYVSPGVTEVEWDHWSQSGSHSTLRKAFSDSLYTDTEVRNYMGRLNVSIDGFAVRYCNSLWSVIPSVLPGATWHLPNLEQSDAVSGNRAKLEKEFSSGDYRWTSSWATGVRWDVFDWTWGGGPTRNFGDSQVVRCISTQPSTCTAPNFGNGTNCSPAPLGHYVNANQEEFPMKCPAGTYQDLTGQTSCKSVTAGYMAVNASNVYVSSAAVGQTICPAGYYCPAGSARVACPAGTYRSTTGASALSQCVATTAGYMAVNASNVYVSSAAVGQAICSAGYYCPAAAARTACSAGTYNPNTGSSSSAACVAIAAGRSGTDSIGNYVDSAAVNHAICPVGYYCPASTGRASCGIGTYQDLTGQSSCKSVTAGYMTVNASNSYVSSAAVGQAICPAGYYCPAGSARTGCPAYTYRSTTGASALSQCLATTAGYMAIDISSSYTTFAAVNQAICPAGYYCPAVSARTACAIYTYNPNTGAAASTACLSCPTAYTSAATTCP